VDRLSRAARGREPALPGWAVTAAARRLVAAARDEFSGLPSQEAPDTELDSPGDFDHWVERVVEAARQLSAGHPRRVINATGIVLHTNLGRAPLAEGAARAAAEAGTAYSNLELDLETGRRGNRLAAVVDKLCLLSGAEAAYACNNNAAALLLALDTLARGREVVVSRGELVEIGGSFRIPEIMERAGVTLVEVGTTNRTHLKDYERAIGPDTALLLKVHRSNFEQSGFVAEVDLAQLGELARSRDLPLLEDLGSGTLVDLSGEGLPQETYAPARLQRGADLVCFSGDKLLGGPQAGILLGAADAVEAARHNPLARALRLDKMNLAALDWTLGALLDGRAKTDLPVVRQLLESPETLEQRARRLAERLRIRLQASVEIKVEKDRTQVGGGSLPAHSLETWVVSLSGPASAQRRITALRRASPPVVARVRENSVLLDLRTLDEAEFDVLEESIAAAFR
jgi:L-seryl-tRNA(Ser) seleniumtransferase